MNSAILHRRYRLVGAECRGRCVAENPCGQNAIDAFILRSRPPHVATSLGRFRALTFARYPWLTKVRRAALRA
ncbi:Glycosyl transferase involved in cell wall bisynthesis [Pseudomonas syringae pv. actinidiae]|uniref:Glycosyl transferase involved in cell wall bisynthesis n=1 Tax=Pseudomonas syringae pv. actinidiae TaxID=103796 RepID=A0AAN4TP86_PSESF|nr:Glycosyl transferase involved in cell wall bisynthesis [Pseudomonas syringae pv. actinidiae]